MTVSPAVGPMTETLHHVAEFVPDPLAHEYMRAADEWGFNCGPAAVCGALVLPPADVRPYFERCGFASKHYTNPKMMFEVLNALGHESGFCWMALPIDEWPNRGVVRIQWGGPWMRAGVPIRARYRHTHWIGVRGGRTNREVFDVNAACVGGWLPYLEWDGQLAPWLCKQTEPKCDGTWSVTHSLAFSGF